MTQTQLLPCPFCGGEACVEEVARHKWIAICADKYRCGTEGWFEDTRDEAIAAWNRRAESADLAALRQEMQSWGQVFQNDRDALNEQIKYWMERSSQHERDAYALRQQVTQLTAACVRAREAIRELIAADYDVAGDLQVIDAALKGADHE